MNNYENILLQKLDTITRLLQLALPETINGNAIRIEDYLTEPLTIPNQNTAAVSKLLKMPSIGSSSAQQSSTRMCKSYTDLVSSLKRGSTITLEEHPKSENSDLTQTRTQFTAAHHHQTSAQQPSTARPVLQQQQRVYNLKYPLRNAQSMFESYDHNNNNNMPCQSTQLSTTQLTATMTTATLTASSVPQQVTATSNYLTTSTNYNLGHSLASLELSDVDLDELDEVSAQTNELQLLINQPVTAEQHEERSASNLSTNSTNQTSSTNNSSVTLRPRSPFDQVSSLSSYSTVRPFQRAASSNVSPTASTDEQNLRRSASLVAHETAINQLGNTVITSAVTANVIPQTSTIAPSSSTISNQSSTGNATQRQDKNNVDNV